MKRLISALLIPATLVSPLTPVHAQVSTEPEPAASAPAESAEAPLPEYFYVPIWGLRVGGVEEFKKRVYDSWKYYRAGKGILKVTPSVIDYGTVVLSKDKLISDVISLQNVGAAPLVVGIIVPPHQYTTSKHCEGAVLPPMATCTFQLNLEPVDVQSATGFVDIPFSSGSQTATATIAVQATVVKPTDAPIPEFTLNTEPVAVPGQPVQEPLVYNPETKRYALVFPPPIYLGDDYHYRSFRLTASGTKPLTFAGASVDAGSNFYLASNNCPSELKIGESCDVTVRLNPLQVGDLRGSMTVKTSSYDNSSLKVDISASVSEWVGRLDYNPSLDFGVVDRGYAATKTVSVTNTGNLNLTGITVKPDAPITLSGTTCNQGGAPLQPGQSCTLTFSVTSSTDRDLTAKATVTAKELTHAAPDIKFSGRVALRQGTFSPGSFSFGLRDMAKLSSTLPVTFTNTGTIAVTPNFGPLRDAAMGRAAYGSPVYKELNGNTWLLLDRGTCANPVAVNGTCTAYFAVQPTSISAQNASFIAYPDAGMSVRGTSLSVSTTGTKQSFVYNPTLIDMGVVNGVQTLNGEIVVTNTSLDATTLTGFSTSITQPSGGKGTISLTGTTCTSSLTAADKTCVIKVQVTGASLAKDETQQSLDGRVLFRYTGADNNYTSVPVNFLLRGNTLEVTHDGLDFGGVPVNATADKLPRRLITVKNPGPSAVAVSNLTATYPSYGMTVYRDTAYPNSCVIGQAIPAGTSCVIALYPYSNYDAGFGAMSSTVQLYTVINGSSVTLGSAMEVKAEHLKPEFEFNKILHVEGGEQKSATYTVGFRLKYDGRVYVDMSSTSATGVNSSVLSCANTVISAANTCSLQVSVGALRARPEVALQAPIKVLSKGSYVAIDHLDFKSTLEQATYTLSDTSWDAGVLPSQYASAEMPAAADKTVLLTNTSKRASIVVNDYSYNTSWFYWPDTSAIVDGVTYPYCRAGALEPGRTCAIRIQVLPSPNNSTVIGGFEETATINTFNSVGKIPYELKVRLVPGALELVEAPDDFVDTPAQGTSANKAVIVRNSGQGYLRWATSSLGLGPFVASTSDTEPAFRISGGSSSGSKNYLPYSLGSYRHKTADSASSLSCNGYYGLAPGASCTLNIFHAPTGASRNYTGNLHVRANLPEPHELVIPLGGNSVAAEVYYSASKFDFPSDMRVGSPYKAQIQVGNAGNYPLSITGINRLGGFLESEVSLQHTCTQQLSPGEECMLEVTLTPDKNHNYETFAPLQYVELTQNSRGVPSVKQFFFTGKSIGAYVTVTPRVKSDVTVEQAERAEKNLLYSVELKNSGDAPVRIVSHTETGHFSYDVLTTPIGTCEVGKTYLPGESCTFEVWVNKAANYISGDFQDKLIFPFTINGSQLDENGKIIYDKRVAIQFKGSYYGSNAAYQVFPSVVPSNRNIPLTILTANEQPGTKISIDGVEKLYDSVNSINLPVSSSAPVAQVQEYHQYIADGKVRGVPVVLKGPHFSVPHNKTISAENFVLALPQESNATVYSTATTTPATRYQIGNRTALEKGGELFLALNSEHLSAHTTDVNGRIVSSKYLGTISSTGRGRTLTFAQNAGFNRGENGSYSVQLHSVLYYVGSYHSYGDYYSSSSTSVFSNHVSVSINPAGEIIGGSLGPIREVGSQARTYRNGNLLSDYYVDLTGYGAYAAPDSTDFVDAIQSVYSGGYRVWSTLNFYGRHNGVTFDSSFSGTAYLTDGSDVSGVVMVDGYLYLRRASSIYAFKINGSQVQAPVKFDYPGALSANGGGLVYNKLAGTLILPCYMDLAVCSIPVKTGGLGLLDVEAGTPGVPGKNDGGPEATLQIYGGQIGVAAPQTGKISVISRLPPYQPRIVSTSTVPTFGSVGAINNTFTLTFNAESVALPHTITLRNQGGIPLNVTGLSNASIAFTSTCDNTPYQGECDVTVQIPYSLWSAATTGTFNINTSTGVSVAAQWTKPLN